MRYTLEPVEMPEWVNKAAVMAVERDRLGIATSPICPASATTGLGYSMMAFLALTIAEFIRNLEYTAIPAGNDVALSISIATDSGLGELGRHGMLITQEYGPRVRLCKLFTDLPLVPYKPIEFEVIEFCKGCNLCTEACPVSAISRDPEQE